MLNPRKSCQGILVSWVTYLCTRILSSVVLIGILRFGLTDWPMASLDTISEYNEAMSGTADGNCVGEKTSRQRALCDEYDMVLSSFPGMRFARHLIKRVPNCLFMECKDVAKEINNSYFAWTLWVVITLLVVINLYAMSRWFMGFVKRWMLNAQIFAVNQDQDYRYQHLNPQVQEIMNAPQMINMHASQQHYQPALMPPNHPPANLMHAFYTVQHEKDD